MLIIDIGNTKIKLLNCSANQIYELNTNDISYNGLPSVNLKNYSLILASSVLDQQHTNEIMTRINEKHKKVFLINSSQIFSLLFNEAAANKFKHIGTDRALKIMYLMSLPTKINISVGCGTAFTIEVISNNKFVDSYILPGFQAQRDALLKSTAQIKNIEFNEHNGDFYHTETSIYKGILFAYINIIKYVEQLWNPDTIVISGGSARLIFNSIKAQISKVTLIEYHELKIMQQFSEQLINEK